MGVAVVTVGDGVETTDPQAAANKSNSDNIMSVRLMSRSFHKSIQDKYTLFYREKQPGVASIGSVNAFARTKG
jgi:hypothetical protein